MIGVSASLTDWWWRSDGGLLIMGKAAQEKVRFRWYDMTRFEVGNKVWPYLARHVISRALSVVRLHYGEGGYSLCSC